MDGQIDYSRSFDSLIAEVKNLNYRLENIEKILYNLNPSSSPMVQIGNEIKDKLSDVVRAIGEMKGGS